MTAAANREIALTSLTHARFLRKPQVGVRVVQEWGSLLSTFFGVPAIVSTKQEAGAWCPADLPGGAVKDGRGPVSLLVADVDDCGAGAIGKSVAALASYCGVVFPSFSATREHEKHRIVLLPSRPLAPDEFPIAWTKMRDALSEAGISLDAGCKNLNRLYFAPAAPSREAWLGARVLDGAPLDVDAMLAVAREEAEEDRREREERARARAPVASPNAYVRGAVAHAREKVLASVEPGRHDCLRDEAWSLARLNLDEPTIRDALLDAFVAVAGEARRREGERTIRDAVSARRRAQ